MFEKNLKNNFSHQHHLRAAVCPEVALGKLGLIDEFPDGGPQDAVVAVVQVAAESLGGVLEGLGVPFDGHQPPLQGLQEQSVVLEAYRHLLVSCGKLVRRPVQLRGHFHEIDGEYLQ